MQSSGYWYYDKKLLDITSDKHINLIIDYPEAFGLTKKYIKETYEKHSETLKSEGAAREEIIIKVIKNSCWIRIRHYTKPKDYWSFNYNNIIDQKNHLRDIINFLITDKKVMNKNEELKLIGFSDNTMFVYLYFNGGAAQFLKEDNSPFQNIELVESIKDFWMFK